MSNKKILAPYIRFNGYSDAWEQRKLGEVADFFDERRIPIDSENRNVGKYPYYGASGVIDYVDDFIFNGEYVLLAEDGANIIMRSSPVAYITSGKFWLNNHAHIMQMKSGSNNFLLQILEKQNYEKFNSGTAQPKLNGRVVKKLVLGIPNKDEQTQIGNFFKQLDNTITLYQRKLKLLNQLKQGFLQQLFPQKDEKVPRVRFNGFEEEWEQQTVGKIFDITRGQVLATGNVSKIKTEKEKYPVYSSQTKNNGLMGYYDEWLFDTAITWTTDGANAGTVNYRPGKFYSTNVNGVLLSDSGYANKAIAELLNKITRKYVSKVGNPKLMNNVMETIPIVVPKVIKEQKMLGDAFNKIDFITGRYQQRLDKLETIKKAYLQLMFI